MATEPQPTTQWECLLKIWDKVNCLDIKITRQNGAIGKLEKKVDAHICNYQTLEKQVAIHRDWRNRCIGGGIVFSAFFAVVGTVIAVVKYLI